MPQVINISDEEIQYSERILLPPGKQFNEERINYIRNFETIDLQAVPGSGKTTALLAKLLILEKKLPLDDGSGILILSHTNAAVDEIKEKIQGQCPKLFAYPNFIGTIQSFVDEYLAIPYFAQVYKKRPVRIDNEIFEEIAESYYRNMPNSAAKTWLGNQREPEYIMKSLVFDTNGNLKTGINGPIILKSSSNTPTYKVLKGIKEKILKSGFLNYDDAYFLAEMYIKDFPEIKNILRKRFSYIFIDEMQDMDTHQYDLIEKLFHENGSVCKIQRIGDKNQAIYNTVKAEDVWSDRASVLRLSQSQRLSAPISKVVTNFALHGGSGFTVEGIGDSTLKPHLIVFTNDTVKEVIPYFSTLVSTFKEEGRLPLIEKYPVKVVAWNTEWKEQAEIDDISKLRLVDYHKSYSKKEAKAKNDYDNLKSYLIYYDKNKQTLESIRKSVLNALLKILRLESISYGEERQFTKKRLLDFLKESHNEKYEEFKLHLFNWSIGIIKGEAEAILTEIRAYLPEFFRIFSQTALASSLNFINDNAVVSVSTDDESNSNIHEENGVKIEITSVHSVKGQTHCATLYLESFFSRGYGNYESERLRNQFVGSQTVTQTIASISTSHDKVKQSAKMAFVGFSRPTDLLCVAVHKDRFDAVLASINTADWEIKNVPMPTVQNVPAS